jgi:hypothetical protein
VSLSPIPEPPGWVSALLRFADWLIGRSAMDRCGHHWHLELPPGGGDVYTSTHYSCCACPAQRHGRPPADAGTRECTRYTP